MTSVFTAVQHFCNLHCMFAHFVLSHLIQTLNTLLYTGKISLWVSFLKSFTKLKCLLLASDEFFSSLYFLPVRNRIWEQILGTQSRGAIKLKRVYPIKHTSPQIQTWLTGKYVSKQEGITSTFVLSFWWELTLSWLTGRIEMPFLSRRASFVQIQHVLLLDRVMQFCRSTTEKSSSADLIPTIILLQYTLHILADCCNLFINCSSKTWN